VSLREAGERSKRIYLYMVLCFCALLVLTRWITKHVQGIGFLLTEDGQIALLLYFLLILPGVLLHELSHAIMALILGVRVRRLSIGLSRKGRSQNISLGSVDIARTDPFRASLIGAAPLVAGCAVILLIGDRVLGIEALPAFGNAGFWRTIEDIYNTPDFWLWIYLVLAVGNAMLPSAADRHSWGTALAFIAFLGAALYFSGLLDIVSAPVASWAENGASQLTYAFAIAAIIDLVFAILLFLVEQSLGLLGFGRIQYR
jgi:hypothetical protein